MFPTHELFAKNRFWAILLVVSFLTGACSHSDVSHQKNEPQREEKIKKLSQYGTSLLMKRRSQKALHVLTKAHRLDPKNKNILNNLGLTYLLLNERKKARVHFVKALKIDPKFGDPWINLGRMEMDVNQYRTARKLFKKATQIDTYVGIANAYANLGLTYYKTKEFEKGLKNFERALIRAPRHCEATIWSARTYRKMKKHRKATQFFRKAAGSACALEPMVHYELARSYLQIKRPDLARKKYVDLMRRFPKTRYSKLAKRRLGSL
jgi:Tfp pilus assembly protein PilF